MHSTLILRRMNNMHNIRVKTWLQENWGGPPAASIRHPNHRAIRSSKINFNHYSLGLMFPSTYFLFKQNTTFGTLK